MPTPDVLIALAADHNDLGLHPDQVALAEPNPNWALAYQQVANHLAQALVGLDAAVEHIGSTSVPELAAKPVLDIAVGAPGHFDKTIFIDRLEQAGFAFQTDLGLYGGLFFTAQAQSERVLANLHVVATNEFQWRWYLAFRDGLRADPALRAEYTQLKRAAALAHPLDRPAYTKAKFDWVLATVTRLAG